MSSTRDAQLEREGKIESDLMNFGVELHLGIPHGVRSFFFLCRYENIIPWMMALIGSGADVYMDE